MHENEETCTLEKVRDAISDELSDLFHKSNSGIQNAFELIFGVLKEQEEKYKADHERLREENKTLIENMKIMQESNLSILEALNRKEISSSKLEDVIVEMNQLVSREKEMEEDQIKSNELLKHLSEKVKVLEFQLQLGTDVDAVPESEVITDSCCTSIKEINATSSETNSINIDNVYDGSPTLSPPKVTLDDDKCSTNNEHILSRQHFSFLKHKFSHKSQSHKTLAGRLTLLEEFKDELKCDINGLKDEISKMRGANKQNEPKMEDDLQEDIMNSDSLASSKDIPSDPNVIQHISSSSTELTPRANFKIKGVFESDVKSTHEPSLKAVNNAESHDAHETSVNNSVHSNQEELSDSTMPYILNRIDFIEQNIRQLKEQSDSISNNLTISHADMDINKTINSDIATISEKLNAIEKKMTSMVSEDYLNSNIEKFIENKSCNLNDSTMHIPSDSQVQYQGHSEGKLETLEKEKVDKFSFQEALSEIEDILYKKIHDEVTEQSCAIEQKIISIQNDFEQYRKNIIDLQRSNSANTQASVETTVENDVLHRFEGLKAIEDEIEKVSMKLAEIPDRNQMNEMLQEIESSVMKKIEIDQSSKPVLDELRKELKDKMTKVEVLKIVKHLLNEAANGSHSDSENSSLMVGYKCLCCNELHPKGIHRFVARKVNHNVLPSGKAFCHTSFLYGQPGLECFRTRPSTADSSPRLPRLTKQQQRPSTASFLSIGGRRSHQRLSSTKEANLIT